MRKVFYLISILYLLVLAGCASTDLYRVNYADDPGMQDRMEKDYGNFPLWD